ncbi:MAG: hypothetical protein A3J76_03845 [Candidatus Moranbacteria bacterium RBG_13_45_13]|nr:MAG: hypothetical protein A3J76_03845 [Candidatus Moranbacteria bacterium RBG_13_45_13]
MTYIFWFFCILAVVWAGEQIVTRGITFIFHFTGLDENYYCQPWIFKKLGQCLREVWEALVLFFGVLALFLINFKESMEEEQGDHW